MCLKILLGVKWAAKSLPKSRRLYKTYLGDILIYSYNLPGQGSVVDLPDLKNVLIMPLLHIFKGTVS